MKLVNAQFSYVPAMVGAIVDFKAELAARLFEQLLTRGAILAYLLFMLSWQVRVIVKAKEVRNQGKPQTEI